MRAMKRRFGKVTAVALLVLGLGLGLGIGAVDLRANVCEEALVRCMDDFFNQVLGGFGMVYCGIGFAFCKKFIDPEN
jgi:hypothetical protein